MKKGGYNFNLYYIPLEESEHYDIANFRPIVEGAVWLGNFNKE